MEKKDLIDLKGKKVKIVLNNDWYYKGVIISVGVDYINLRDFNDKSCFIVLKGIKLLEVIE